MAEEVTWALSAYAVAMQCPVLTLVYAVAMRCPGMTPVSVYEFALRSAVPDIGCEGIRWKPQRKLPQ
eukprot:1454249-Rhodomonas_salina.1